MFRVAALFAVLLTARGQLISLEKDGLTFSLDDRNGQLLMSLSEGGLEKLTAQLGVDINLNNLSYCTGLSNCIQIDDTRLHVFSSVDNGFTILWSGLYNSTTQTGPQFRDCYDLRKDDTNWFGGPERYHQHWPIEKLELSNFANVVQESGSGAIVEPYWLNSKGAYIFVDERVPLFIDQNTYRDDAVCFSAKVESPFPMDRNRILLNYTIVAVDDAKQAHLHAVRHFLGKPTGHPNYRLIERQIWSTWARYKKDISDAVLLEYANEIVAHGFTDGQFEIDDFWETCYGSLEFRSPEFSDIGNTVRTIKDMGFTVSLWTHPFVNVDCANYTEIGIKNNFFVRNFANSVLTRWWNSNNDGAQLIDFTNAEAVDWFVNRLRLLQQNHDIDSFKFDAGETSWAPQVPMLYVDSETSPNMMTNEYVRGCAQLGDLIEVRSGWKTQDLPVFVRMLDKDSRWGIDNGLRTLVTTLLQMNMNGYTMVLPDMIGGNGYGTPPTAELFVRWLQANTFMPSVQFSFVPWDFESQNEIDVVGISKIFVELHRLYADEIVKAMERSISDGYPVNPPIWWIDTSSADALKEDTEFLLGEDILVAPVLDEHAVARDVYLPSGTWVDCNTLEVYEGNQILVNYPAPISVLPYFVRRGTNAEKILKNKFLI